MMIIASNNIPRLQQLISVQLRHGSSPTAIVDQIRRAVNGLYSPIGGYTIKDLDIAFLCKAIGGRRLLYTLNHSHGIPSAAALHRHHIIPKLLSSVGQPSSSEISANITSFFNPQIKPTPNAINNIIPGNILCFDGIAIETKCRYCPIQKMIIGLCREHAKNFDPHVTGPETIKNLLEQLQADTPDKKVCWGVEATVVAVAPYTRSDYYAPVPIVLSPSDKSEKSDSLAQWIQVVIDTWKTHETGGNKYGDIWSIASDGDATFRRVRHELCTKVPLNPNSSLGLKLYPLVGMNCYTSKELITASCDPQHIFKRRWSNHCNYLYPLIY